MGSAATYLTGVLTLPRHLISSQAKLRRWLASSAFICMQVKWVGVLLCLFFPFITAHAAPLAITVVLSEQGGQYLEFSEALRNKLLDKNVHLNIVSSQAYTAPERGIVVAAGMTAATIVAASKAAAVLNALIPESGYEKLKGDFPQRAGSKIFSAIFLEQPIERHLRLIKAMLPNKRHIGILTYKAPEIDLSDLRHRVVRHKFVLHEKQLSEESQLYPALQEILNASDVLFALPDTSIYNTSTMRNILMATYRTGDPVVGFSPAYVRAGALAAVYSTPEQVAEQAVKAILQYGETRILPAAQYPQLYEVSVNERVAYSLGLTLKSAAELHQEISAIIGDEP